MSTMRNSVMLIGKVADIVRKDNVVRFNINVSEFIKVDGEWKQETQLFNCIGYNTIADRVELLKEDTQIAIEGKLHNYPYKANDKTLVVTRIIVNDIIVLASLKK